jgi:inosose dehydratase
MLDIKIGSAPDSWGVWFASDPKQIPWQRFLDEVAEAGYPWTELGPYGYLPTDTETLRAEVDRRKLKVCAAVAMGHLEDPAAWPNLEKQIVGGCDLVAALGGKYLVLIDDTYTDLFTGRPTGPVRLEGDAWKRLIAGTHHVADLVRTRFGLSVVFHPHADTHVQYEDQIERLLEDTDPERVWLCLDTGHHAYCGGDPIAFMRKHHRRVGYLHLKSVDGAIKAKVDAERIPFAKAVGMNMFCEPAQGVVNFRAFADVLHSVNYRGFAIVEQDMYPTQFDRPLPIAKRTRTYLHELGIG